MPESHKLGNSVFNSPGAYMIPSYSSKNEPCLRRCPTWETAVGPACGSSALCLGRLFTHSVCSVIQQKCRLVFIQSFMSLQWMGKLCINLSAFCLDRFCVFLLRSWLFEQVSATSLNNLAFSWLSEGSLGGGGGETG